MTVHSYQVSLSLSGLGIPSADVDCMCILALLRHLKIQTTEVFGHLGAPLLRSFDNSCNIEGYQGIVDYIMHDASAPSFDDHLSSRRKAESAAFASDIRLRCSALATMLLLECSSNWPVFYSEVGRSIPFLWRPFVLYSHRRHALRRTDPALLRSVQNDGLEAAVPAAKAIIASIHSLLADGSTPFLFGRNMSVADAICFGALSVCFFTALPNNPFAQLLQEDRVVANWASAVRNELFVAPTAGTLIMLRPPPPLVTDRFEVSVSLVLMGRMRFTVAAVASLALYLVYVSPTARALGAHFALKMLNDGEDDDDDDEDDDDKDEGEDESTGGPEEGELSDAEGSQDAGDNEDADDDESESQGDYEGGDGHEPDDD